MTLKNPNLSKICSRIDPLLLFSVNTNLIHNLSTDYSVEICTDPKYFSHSNIF